MSNHELFNSYMLYIHPPLAIIGYVFVFIFTILMLRSAKKSRVTRYSAIASWVFTFTGLITGMLWAQISWGSYWSWDPKETLTLLLFLAVSGFSVTYFEKMPKLTKMLAILSCVLTIITALSSFIIAGLHSFA